MFTARAVPLLTRIGKGRCSWVWPKGSASKEGMLAGKSTINKKKTLDFHPHLHAMVADGLFARDGRFRVLVAP